MAFQLSPGWCVTKLLITVAFGFTSRFLVFACGRVKMPYDTWTVHTKADLALQKENLDVSKKKLCRAELSFNPHSCRHKSSVPGKGEKGGGSGGGGKAAASRVENIVIVANYASTSSPQRNRALLVSFAVHSVRRVQWSEATCATSTHLPPHHCCLQPGGVLSLAVKWAAIDWRRVILKYRRNPTVACLVGIGGHGASDG